MPALAELEAAWVAARDDPGFRDGARPAAARLRGAADAAVPRRAAVRARRARRCAQARGPAPHRRAQDQQRARPGAAGAAHGQAARSSPRPAPGQHGVATRDGVRAARAASASSTWAPRTCAASVPTSSAWSCWARRVVPVEAGARTLKEAVSEAIRDWVDERRHARTTSSARPSGPAPYPALVRDLQRVIGDEARAQVLEREGRLPDRVIACVGGGSNAIGTFTAVRRRRRRRADRRRGGRRGARGRPPRRAADRRRARRASCTASLSAVMQDEDGQIVEAHSVSAGLDYPGVGPEHA